MKFQGLLFDLDGTLIDSRADLTKSINLMLQDFGYRQLPHEQVLSFVGEGIRLLVERALRASLNQEPVEEQIQAALAVYAEKYRIHLLDETTTYPGVFSTLTALTDYPKAVVTNKPIRFTQTILAELKLAPHFLAVLGGDSTPERKPAPRPLLEAARLCNVNATQCLMIGDTKIDMEAGKAAGMKTCGFVGGFRGKEEFTSENADYVINHFEELISLLGRDAHQ